MRFILLATIAFGLVLAFIIIAVRQPPEPTVVKPSGLYATIPFRPKVIYDGSTVVFTNTEEAPYLDTRLNIYVGSILYTALIGTIQPGETITCPFKLLVNDHNESFRAGAPRTSELEVRAHFRGNDDHKDFPPP